MGMHLYVERNLRNIKKCQTIKYSNNCDFSINFFLSIYRTMEPVVSLKNPWAVDSLDNFTFYCCPECNIRSQNKQEFINHAFSKHPEGAPALYLIKDQTVQGVNFPLNDELKVESDIKDEIEINFNTSDLLQGEEPMDDDFDYDMDDEEAGELKGDFKCLVCERTFDTAGKLSSHGCASMKRSAINYKLLDKNPKHFERFECPHCDFQTFNHAQYKAHEKKHRKENNCDECDLKFTSFTKLKNHLFKEHKVTRETEKCLCSLCGKTLVGRSNFKKHEREKHGIENISRKRILKPLKVECSKCQKVFKETWELNRHVKECQEVSKDFECPQCDILWASGPVLNLHLKKDHKEVEMYTCHICGKSFKRKISVESHIKVEHEGIKDHVCHLCGTGFARAQGLKFHIQRVHEHSGRYACEYCDFKTVAQMKLDIHVNEVHTKSIKFACDQCNFFCYRKGGLLAHVKTVHLKLKPHECPGCPEAFVRRKELEKHRVTAGH